jgi:hypothetical protein
MARKNNRWDTHQSIGPEPDPRRHECEPIATRTGHICLLCGRPVVVTV